MRRARVPMPETVRRALQQRGVMAEYRERPAYQRNDYLAWILAAKRASTRQRRLDQMLDELERGGVYMNMEHRPSAKRHDP